MVTASHNPEEYNGLKVFNPDGSSFSPRQQAVLEESLAHYRWADWKSQGVERPFDAISLHKKAILDTVSVSRRFLRFAITGSSSASFSSLS
jgi:phosphoglucosamine mutase